MPTMNQDPKSSSWHSSSFSSSSKVMVVNKSPVPIVVFSFPFVDPVYVAFSDKAEIKPGQNAVLEAASMGAGKITIGVATRIVRQAGGKPIDYAMAVASADLCQVAMLGQPRYELGLKNAVDNTVAEVVMGGDNKLLLKGPSVSRCSVGDSTEIEGASDTGMAFMRFAQLCAKTGLAVATGGGSAAAQKGAVEALKVGAKKLAKKLASKGASEVAKTADLQGKAKRQAKKNLGMVPVKPQPRGGGGGGGGFSGGAMQCSTSGKCCSVPLIIMLVGFAVFPAWYVAFCTFKKYSEGKICSFVSMSMAVLATIALFVILYTQTTIFTSSYSSYYYYYYY